jgi:hypothetical protein
MIEEILKDLDPTTYQYFTNTYDYNGVQVPRVTQILSAMLHEDSLMDWSNFIGLVKHQKYKLVLEQAADKGTIVHNAIEDYIQNNKDLDLSTVPNMYVNEVDNAYSSFLLWWNTITKNKVDVLYQEKTLVCQWFGGTLDILLNVNGGIYLMDFKTSNHITYKYLLQLAAYRWMVRNLLNIEVDGVGIIRVSKKDVSFEEVVLDMHKEEDLNLLNHCEVCFANLVNGYYERAYIQNACKERGIL